jgi:hypothetical protein
MTATQRRRDMTSTPGDPLRDEAMETVPGQAGANPGPRDADGTDADSTDVRDADGTDATDTRDADGTDAGDADSTDAGDADSTDSRDADGTDA